MLIEKLKKMLAKKEERKKELKNRAEKCEEIEELRSINSEVDKLNGEIAELRGLIEDLEAGDEEEETRQAGPIGKWRSLQHMEQVMEKKEKMRGVKK